MNLLLFSNLNKFISDPGLFYINDLTKKIQYIIVYPIQFQYVICISRSGCILFILCYAGAQNWKFLALYFTGFFPSLIQTIRLIQPQKYKGYSFVGRQQTSAESNYMRNLEVRSVATCDQWICIGDCYNPYEHRSIGVAKIKKMRKIKIIFWIIIIIFVCLNKCYILQFSASKINDRSNKLIIEKQSFICFFILNYQINTSKFYKQTKIQLPNLDYFQKIITNFKQYMQNTPQYFLSIAHLFKLGCLQTQQLHPQTKGLSNYAKYDLPTAINKIKSLDIKVIQILSNKSQQLFQLYSAINTTLKNGGNIYICGCGATGRLSLVLETLWRQQCQHISLGQYKERVISFMAGGDAALIKSIEDFQDHPQFAQNQLVQLKFSENDLLIGSTQGGETPWVIGAIWKATTISKQKPFILYGNPDQLLIKHVQRSRKFIQSDLIHKINMNVGPMAISGSTRMQSTTILMYGIGLAMLGCDRMRELRKQEIVWKVYFKNNVEIFLSYIKETDFTILKDLTQYQSQIYKKNQDVSYITSPYYAISILTDTTQRSPTFSLNPFQNINDESILKCWCNLILDSSQKLISSPQNTIADWSKILGNRPIRSLDSSYWQKYYQKVSLKRISGFSLNIPKKHSIKVQRPLNFTTDSGLSITFPKYPLQCRLSQHILLKILINNHSTLIMGRLDRYESNVMTYVRATNNKLIDRTARCVMMIKQGLQYSDVIRGIYEIKDKISEDEPIVLRVVEHLNKKC